MLFLASIGPTPTPLWTSERIKYLCMPP